MRALILQHIECEPPGAYEDVLRERGCELERVELDEGEALPDWRAFGAIVAMGGPMSVNDEDALPWLRAEKQLIAAAVRAGVPFFGACLGVQLLASALGASVYPGPAPEIGLLPVRLTEAARSDPVFAGLPEELLTFQWHGDTFDLPPGATLLAGSPAYANQAFRFGTHAYGVQFHLEVSPEMARDWALVPEYAASLESALGAGSAGPLIDELAARAGAMQAHARSLFGRWLELATMTRDTASSRPGADRPS
jgi:GMP synthase-like glutamine amidotransferase